MQALTTKPPSLKAVIPMSAEFDGYLAFNNGGVTSPEVVSTPGTVGRTGSAGAARDRTAVAVDGPDGTKMLAEAVATHANNIETPGYVPYRDSPSEEIGVKWWEVATPHNYMPKLKQPGVGVLAVANWDEAGTRHGAFITKNNVPNAKLLVGPGTHCAWTYVKDQTGFELVTEELRFYDYWLKGVQNNVMSEPAVTYYTYNAPKESAWRTSKTWPLTNEMRTNFHLGQGALSKDKPKDSGTDKVSFSTPAAAQSTTIASPDGGASYQTEPLAVDMEVTGHPVMHLWMTANVIDTDVMAKIDDVAPDGTTRSYQMLGRLRASHRAPAKAPYNYLGLPWQTHDRNDARLLASGAPALLDFDLLPMSYIFKAGHRLRLTLTFTDPQRRAAAQGQVSVLRSPTQDSYLTLPVIPTRR
jgi:putative CocE/NonD family hydrolase